jgi:purine-binding chemotaxis protein CheW
MNDRGQSVLLLRIGAATCAVPLHDVVETMRPLPVEPVGGASSCVRGVARVRGEAVPVVDLASVLGDHDGATPTRFVIVRAGRRSVALVADAVLGTRSLAVARLQALPPLLSGAPAHVVESLAVDAELVRLLRTSRLLPDDAWDALPPRDAP